MRRLTVTHEQGITLLEILIAFVIAGTLAALGLPQLFAMLNQNQVKTGLDLVQGALLDVQRQAIRQSKPCTLQLDNGTSNGSLTTYEQLIAKTGCLAALSSQFKTVGSETKQMVTLPDEVRMVTNITGTTPQVTFSLKGHTPGLTFDPIANQATIVVVPYNPNANTIYDPKDTRNEQKCVVVASVLGLVRTGIYSPNDVNNRVGGSGFTSVKATDCHTAIDGWQARPNP